MLWIFSIICLLIVLVGVPLRVHLDGRIQEYVVMTEILERTPLTEVGYLVNKLQVIQYNAWLTYWQRLEEYPLVAFFVPDTINELKLINLVPWVSYSVPGTTIKTIHSTTKEQIKKSKGIVIIIRGQDVIIEEIKTR
jgi:hypothetical protein